MSDSETPEISEIKTASIPTLRRLAVYHHYLLGIQAHGRDVVSCTHIGDDLKLDPTQVRKDLAVTGIVGKAKVGYSVPILIQAITNFLGWNKKTEAFIAGAGHLGQALIGFQGIKQNGLDIVAAFDIHPEKIGKTVGGVMVLAIEKLTNLAQRMKVKTGIITVPATAAQIVANLMIEGGIQAIWNFSMTQLSVPATVVVENINLTSSWAILSRGLQGNTNGTEPQGNPQTPSL